jgi:WD40 repeat protein
MTAESWFQKIHDDARPDAVSLAESLATATLIEMELIRHMRLTLHPTLDAGVESDLWFSGFVQARAHDGIILHPRAAAFLRQRLYRRNPHSYDAAWMEVSRFHKDLPPAVQIEEEIAYLSALPGAASLGKIRRHLRSALAALVAGERSGIATWIVRALAQLPGEVRMLEEARMLEAAARVRLSGDAALLEAHPDWQWLMPAAPAATTVLGLRMFPGVLEIGPEHVDRANGIEVSDLEPVSLHVTWPGGEAAVSIDKGGTRRIRVGDGPLRITASTGEAFEIVSGASSAVIDFSDLLQSYNEFHGAAIIDRAVGVDLDHGGQLCVLVGPPGTGKTAVLDYFARLRPSAADARQTPEIPIVCQFFSRSSGRYRDPDGAMRSLCAQVERLVPDMRLPEQLSENDRLEYLLENGSFASTVLMILDGLDEAEAGTDSRLFRFLAKPIPSQLCVLVSCTRDAEVHRWLQTRDRVRWYNVEDWPEVLYEAVRTMIERDAEPRLQPRFFRLANNNPLLASILTRYKFWAQEIEETEPVLMVWQAIWRWTATDQPEYMRALAIIAAMQEPVPERWVAEVLGRSTGTLWPEFFTRTAALLDQRRRHDGTVTYCPYHEQVRLFILEHFAREIPHLHLRIAQTIARWPLPSDTTDPYRQAYVIQHGLYHAAASNDPYLLFHRATDLGYVRERLQALSPTHIAAEMRTHAVLIGADSRGNAHAHSQVVKAIADALEWNSGVIARDPSLVDSIVFTHVRQVTDADAIYGALRFRAGVPTVRLRQPLREGPPSESGAAPGPAARLPLHPVRTGHTGPVLGCIVAHANEPVLVSWSADKTICIWDLASLHLRAIATHHADEVTACALLQEPDTFVSTSRDGCVAVFRSDGFVTSGYHESGVLGVIVIPVLLPVPEDYAPRFVTWSTDRTVRLWQFEGARLHALGVLRRHTDEVLSCDVGRFLVSGAADGTVRLWDLHAMTELARLDGQGAVKVVRISPAGFEGLITVVFGSQDCSLNVWQIGYIEKSDGSYDLTPYKVQKLTGHTLGILDCQVDFDRHVIVSASLDQTARLWDLRDGTALQTLTGHQAAVLKCGFLPDHSGISTSADQTARLWDVETGRLLDTFNEHAGPVRNYLPLGSDLPMRHTQVVSCADDRSLMLWDAARRRSPSQRQQTSMQPQAALRVDGLQRALHVCFLDHAANVVYTASGHRGFEMYDLLSERQVVRSQIEGTVRGAIGSARLRMGFAWTDNAAFVWQFPEGRDSSILQATGNVTALPREIGQGIRSAAFVAGRRLAVAYAQSSRIVVMDAFGPVLTSLEGHEDSIVAVASDAEGQLLVSASRDQTVRVWNGENYASVAVLSGHTDRVSGCAVTPSADRIVTYAADRTLRVWERSGSGFAPTAVMQGHRDEITCVAIDAGKERTVSGSRDGTIRIWDTTSGRQLHVLDGHRGWITAVLVTEDGWIISCAEDGTMKFWDMDAGTGHETIVGLCPFVSVAASGAVMCAGDQAGNLWRLERGPVQARPFTREAKVVVLATSFDRPLATQLKSALLEEKVDAEILDMDHTSDSWKQIASVGQADLTLILATERLYALHDAHLFEYALRRAAGGRPLVPLWENRAAWRTSELMQYHGIDLPGDSPARFQEVGRRLRAMMIDATHQA